MFAVCDSRQARQTRPADITVAGGRENASIRGFLLLHPGHSLLNCTTHTESGSPPLLVKALQECLLMNRNVLLQVSTWFSPYGVDNQGFIRWSQYTAQAGLEFTTSCFSILSTGTFKYGLLQLASYRKKKKKMVATHTTPFNWLVHVHLTQLNKLFNL